MKHIRLFESDKTEMTMPEFFELSKEKQSAVPSVFGLNAEERASVETMADNFIETEDLLMDDEESREAAGDKFYEDHNDESCWKDVVDQEKMGGALSYGTAYIKFSNSLDEENKENMQHIKLFEAFLEESKMDKSKDRTVLTDEIKKLIKSSSDIFGVGDFEEGDENEITQEDFDDVIDDADTLGDLIKELDKQFSVDSRKVFYDKSISPLTLSEDNFADMFDKGFSPAKPVNEDSEKDRYARVVKDLDEVRPRMAPAPKPVGMMASEGTKHFKLYIQDEASYIFCDKYGYEKGILNWEYVLGKSSGAMFAASAEIANQKLQMLKDLGILDKYGNNYFERSYFDLWKEWKAAKAANFKAAA